MQVLQQQNRGGCGWPDVIRPNSWPIAVSLAVFAAFMKSFGVNLQKLAWTKKQHRSSIYRDYWLLGMVFIVLASIFDFVALAYGPESVIAPIGVLTMVANAFIAPWMHGEKLHPSVLKATAIIMVGCATAVAAASHSNNIICDIDLSLYLRSRFLLYVISVFGIVGSIYGFIKRAEKLKAEFGEDSEAYQAVFRYHRISYAGISGIFGGQSVLFTRIVELLFPDGGRIFLAHPGSSIVVFCLVGCIFLQLYWLNQGLARFESLYNVPVFSSAWIVGTVLGGGIFYAEHDYFSDEQAFFALLGVIVCCIGVFLLSRGISEERKVGIESEGDDTENALEQADAGVEKVVIWNEVRYVKAE